MKIRFVSFVFATITLGSTISSCSSNGDKADAYGTFEADEVTVSAEASGKLVKYIIDEGIAVKEGQQVGVIDTVQLSLKIDQLNAQIKSVSTKVPNINAQAEVQREQVRVLEVEQVRIKSMIADGAATQKQLDDIDGRVSLAKKQLDAIEVQKISVSAEVESLKTQIASVQDQLNRCRIINPIDGTVLVSYSNQYEIVNQGKSLYKVADLEYMYLRAYVSGDMLSKFQIGKKVKVSIDGENRSLIDTEGIITWVASEAEFTPKIIQTKEERVKLVYAVKIKVKNNGQFKIGMPGEVNLIENQ